MFELLNCVPQAKLNTSFCKVQTIFAKFEHENHTAYYGHNNKIFFLVCFHFEIKVELLRIKLNFQFRK